MRSRCSRRAIVTAAARLFACLCTRQRKPNTRAPIHATPSSKTTQALLATLAAPHPGLAAGAAANTAVFVAGIGVLLRGLTWEGVLNSWLLGALSFAAFGGGGYLLVCLYFIFGTLVRPAFLEGGCSEGLAGGGFCRRRQGRVGGAESPKLPEPHSFAIASPTSVSSPKSNPTTR